MQTIIIDAEFKKIIPPQTTEEHAGLEAMIIAEGCREPLITWGGTLVDGHNRYEICTRLNIPFETREMFFEDVDAVMVWIIDNQLSRRNLQPIDRVAAAEKKREILEKQARARQKEAGEQYGRSSSPKLPVNLPEAIDKDEWTSPPEKKRENEVNEQLAQSVGVSRKTYEALKAIVENGTESLKKAVRDNNVGAATAKDIAALSEEKQDNIVAAIERGEKAKDAIKPHVSNNSGENEWYTPPEFIEAARRVMGGIDTDPASSEIANKTVQATTFYTAESDGLSQIWTGKIWMNPPYAQPLMAQFCDAIVSKYESKEISSACVLVNNATETAWFQTMLTMASAVCFIKKRIRFNNPMGEPTGSPLQGQCMIYFGEDVELFSRELSDFGKVLWA